MCGTCLQSSKLVSSSQFSGTLKAGWAFCLNNKTSCRGNWLQWSIRSHIRYIIIYFWVSLDHRIISFTLFAWTCISTLRAVVGEPWADTALSLLPYMLHSIYPSVPLTPVSYSVTSMLTHEAVDRKFLATCLTLRPHPKETPLWTGSSRASHTDSESQCTVSSLGKSAAVDFYITIWYCSGCLLIQVICCNDLTFLWKGAHLDGWMNRRTYRASSAVMETWEAWVTWKTTTVVFYVEDHMKKYIKHYKSSGWKHTN